jgi:hypothetical protein
MKQKPIIRMFVVEQPGAKARVLRLAVLPDRISLDGEETPYSAMVSRRVQDGCIRFWQGEKNVTFAIQGAVSRGSSDPNATILVNDLMDALVAKNLPQTAEILAVLSKRKAAIRNFAFGLVLYIIVLAVAFGALKEETFSAYPWPHGLLAILLAVGGPWIVSALFRVAGRVRRHSRDSGTESGSNPGTGAT